MVLLGLGSPKSVIPLKVFERSGACKLTCRQRAGPETKGRRNVDHAQVSPETKRELPSSDLRVTVGGRRLNISPGVRRPMVPLESSFYQIVPTRTLGADSYCPRRLSELHDRVHGGRRPGSLRLMRPDSPGDALRFPAWPGLRLGCQSVGLGQRGPVRSRRAHWQFGAGSGV